MELLCAPTIDGPQPPSRLPSAKDAYNIFARLRTDDIKAQQNRALIQDMFDGAPPYCPNKLRTLGQSDRCNLNFGDAASVRDAALSGYLDLTNSVDYIANFRVRMGDPANRPEWGRIVAEEFHEFYKRWPKGEYNLQRLTDRFVVQGVAMAYFDDTKYWGWEPSSLGDFRIPRNTAANEEAIEIATCTRWMPVHKLADMIRNEKVAANLGWNIKEVKAAIWRACHAADKKLPNWNEVEEFQRMVKENGLHYGHGESGHQVQLVYYWVQELPKDGKPGKVTMAIGLEDGKNDDWLCKQIGKFDSIHQCLTIFCYGIGNGTYHTIRGLGHKIFPHIQVLNRTLCDMVDMLRLSGALLVQPDNTNDLQQTALTYLGPMAALAPGFKILDRRFPTANISMLPAVHEMDMRMQNNAGQYRGRATTPDGQARTATEVRAQLQQEAILSQDAMNLFYIPFTRLLREMYRRLARKGWTAAERGGKEAIEFRKRVLARGVPEEVFDSIDPMDIEAVRAVGYGSPQMRNLALDELLQLAGALDEVGRNALMRDRIAARVGYAQVDRYLPKIEVGARPTLDAQMASLENELLKNGIRPKAQPGQAHAIHAQSHLEAGAPFLKLVQEQPDQIEQIGPLRIAEALEGIGLHALEHIEAFAGDQTRQELYAQLKPLAHNMVQTATGMLRILEQKQRAQMRAEQSQPQPGPDGAAPAGPDMNDHLSRNMDMAAEMQRHALEMRIREEEHQQRLSQQVAESRQQMAIKDAEAAQEIALRAKKL